jgi:hypothetical protein
LIGLPADYSVINFIPDSRFATVHYDCYQGQDLVVSLDLPFIGWAIVLERYVDDPSNFGTKLIAVGLDENGVPFTPVDIAANFSLEIGQIIQTKLVAVDSKEAAGEANPGWGAMPANPLATPAP